MRRHRNKIHALIDYRGNYIYDCNGIKETAIDYYQQLFNGKLNIEFPHIDTSMKINSARHRYLSGSVTLAEIREVLFSINDAKSPDLDGFSAKFYKHHWDDLLNISGFHSHQITSMWVTVFPYCIRLLGAPCGRHCFLNWICSL